MNENYRYCQNGNFYFSQEECAILRKFHNNEVRRNAQEIPGCNYRARFYENDGIFSVYSYHTWVCDISIQDGIFLVRKEWDGYSATTMKHINKFLDIFGLPHISKKQWENFSTDWNVIER